MPTFYFIRHGEKVMDIPNPPLTKIGRQQAIVTAQYLGQFPITRIVASPLIRAQETAEIIARPFNLPVETDDRLKERMLWMINEGATREEFISEWIKTTRDRDYVPRWGDSSRNTGKKMVNITREFKDDDHVVLVSHGGSIVDFLQTTFDKKVLMPLIKKYPDGENFSVKECSVTQVELKNNTYTVVRLHHTGHLED